MKTIKIIAGVIVLPIALPIVIIGLIISGFIMGCQQVFEWLGIPN